MSTDEWDSYRRDSTFSGGFPVAASTMPAAAAAAPCVDLPAGPPPECAILDEPMPVPPDGGAFADPSEAISHLLLPEERPVASFEVRFGVPPLSCWSYVFRPELCCCPLATRSRPGRGLLVVTTSNRVIEWRYAGSEGCCASASSASVRSAPLHSLVHAQVLRAARPITALERCAGLMACSVRAPAAAGLVLTFGSVAASASASALAAAVTGLPAAVSAKADLASFTATAAFAAGAPPLAAASAFLSSAWAAFSAALAPLLAILGFLPAILATLTGGLLDCAKPTGAAGSARHPQVITIVSTEADLMNAEGRGQGVDSTGATDSGFASLVALQHRLLAVKAAAANLSLGRAGGAAALRAATTAGAHGDGWRVLPEGTEAPLLSLAGEADPAQPTAARFAASAPGSPLAGPASHRGSASDAAVAVDAGGGSVASPLVAGARPARARGGSARSRGGSAGDPGALLASLDTRVLPLLPAERVLAVLPSVRSMSLVDVLTLVVVVTAAVLTFTGSICAFVASGSADHAGCGDLLSPALALLLLAAAAAASAAGAGEGSGFVALPGRQAVGAFLVALLAAQIVAPGGGDVLSGLLQLAASLVGTWASWALWRELSEAASAMSVIVLSSHRVAAVAVRSAAHAASGTLTDPDGIAVATDTWWLPFGVDTGFVTRNRWSVVAEVLARGAGGALRFTPHLQPRRGWWWAPWRRALTPTGLARADTFTSALMHSSAPPAGVRLARLPPPPPGALLSFADTDPHFERGAFDGDGVAGRLRLLAGEAALAFVDSTRAREGCARRALRWAACGVCPSDGQQRAVLTDRRLFAVAWAANRPSCCSRALLLKSDVVLFGPAAEAADVIAVSGGSCLDRCARARCPCEPDRSAAHAALALTFGSVQVQLRRSTSLAAEGETATSPAAWAGFLDAPLLTHFARVLSAFAAEAQRLVDSDGAPAPRPLADPAGLSLAPLQAAFPAPSALPGPRPQCLPELRHRWRAAATSDVLPPPATSLAAEAPQTPVRQSSPSAAAAGGATAGMSDDGSDEAALSASNFDDGRDGLGSEMGDGGAAGAGSSESGDGDGDGLPMLPHPDMPGAPMGGQHNWSQ